MKIQIVLAWFLFLIVFPNMSYSGSFKNATRLLEPMLLDLVLPLGTSRNEYEFNSLGQYNFKHHAAEINPEFEYTYTDGYGIEVAFPMKNSESRPGHPDVALIMSQTHLLVAAHAKIQFGFGMKRSDHENFPHAATRIIFGF